MNKLTIVGAALAAALTVSTEARAAVKVITSTQDLASIVSEIGGDKVTVEALARGYQDPHQVEAKPSFVIKLHGADLLVVVGRELEIAWLPAADHTEPQLEDPTGQSGLSRCLAHRADPGHADRSDYPGDGRRSSAG